MDELNQVKGMINAYLGLVFKIGLIIVILATFFLFANLTTEIYDTPKFLVLLVFTGLMLVLLTLKFTIAGKVVFVRTPLDIPLLLILAVGIVSTVLSPSPYVALLGHQLKIHGSLVSIVALVLFYFILVNNLRHAKDIKWLLTITIIGAQVLSVVTLISYAGLKILPETWRVGTNFTPTGSSFSTTAILALLLPVVIWQILSGSNLIVKSVNSLFFALMGITIALTGVWATWIGALSGLGLTALVISLNKKEEISRIKPLTWIALSIPAVLITLITILSFIPPMGSAQNPIYTMSRNFPREIQLPFAVSWKISVSAFRDLPFWGTGPSTYSFDFTNYKPIEFNSTKIWNLRFDSPFNEYLQVLATLGGIGLIGLLSLTALFISSAYRVISQALHLEGEEMRLHLRGEKIGLAVSGIVFFIILALHASSLSLWIVGLLILASFMVINLSESLQRNWSNAGGNFKSMFLRIASLSATSSSETIKVETLPGILMTVSLGLLLAAGFFGGKFVLADYHHRLALNAVAQNQGIAAYNELIAAEKLNPFNDLYRTDLAQVNFALANAIASAKGPTEASPAGSLTDQDKQNIQVLLQQSINEGRTAVTLSPRSVTNLEILAMLYRQISGVAQNALVFSLDSYGRAIFQDPLNPQLRVNVGGVYYAIKNYDLAIRFFTDAINLKPDFANGYYNLSVALKDKGDLNTALSLAEKTLTLVDSNSQDYKTVSDYIADLKSKINPAGSQQQGESPTQPPASETSGALQEEELPKVIDLPKPEKIATPEAIKKPNATPTPLPSPSPNQSED